MTPLTSLDKNGVLTKKRQLNALRNLKSEGFNEAVSLLEQVNVKVDEEELANILYEADFPGKKLNSSWVGITTQIRYVNLAKSLSQSINQWAYLEVKKCG